MALIVETVQPDGKAALAGLLPDDRLLTYHGQTLLSTAALLALEENTPGGQEITLRWQRDGQDHTSRLPSGPLGLQTRPEMPADLLESYAAGREAWAAGDHALAARRWQQAAEQAQGVGEGDVSAWLWGQAGAAWERAGEWQSALWAHERSWEGQRGQSETALQSQALRSLGRCARRQSSWEAAQGWYESARQVDAVSGRSMWEAASLHGLGAVARDRGALEQAEDLFTRALQIHERLAPGSLDVARSLNNLGLVAHKRGALEQAEDLFTRALQIQERFAPGSLEVAWSLNNLGIVACERGALEQAEDLFTRAQQIFERLAPGSLEVARSLDNLGIIAGERGALEQAEDLFSRALQITERLAPGSLEVARSLVNLGIVARQRGALEQAEDLFMRALQIFERLAPGSMDVAKSLNSLGSVARDRGALEQAEDLFTRAQQIHERLAPGSLDVARNLNNLGIVARQRGALEQAEDLFTRAQQIQERLAPGSLLVVGSLGNLGIVARHRGALEQAQELHTRALQITERLAPGSFSHAEILSELADTHLKQQHPERAIPCLELALELLEQQRAQIATPEARALLMAQHTAKYAALLCAYLQTNQPERAFATLERGRARSLLEMLAERRLDSLAEAPRDLLDQQQALERQRARAYHQLAQRSATPADDQPIEALRKQLRDLERQQQALTQQMRQRSPRYAALQYPQPLDCQAAQAQLAPGTLLLAYLVDEEQTLLVALSHRQVQGFVLPVTRQALQEQVQALRRALDLTDIQSSLSRSVAQRKPLYALLVGPVQAQVGRARRLLLCPDGPLHLLPWSALVMSSGRRVRYLGQSKPLAVTLSMSLYAQTRSPRHLPETDEAGQDKPARPPARRPSPPGEIGRRLLALGDPVYAPVQAERTPALARSAPPAPQSPASELEALCTRGLKLSALPHTRQEVQAIAELFAEQATIKLGAEATKSAALQQSAQVDLLHFACHGWLDAQMPLSSGLLLSPPARLRQPAEPPDNGLLQAWEIFARMRLRADLVVLSACQSGLGQELRGEGVVGLTRAFQYAGAQNVLVSLWEIHDASTSLFMQAFYTQLQAGTSQAEALRFAMQQLRRHPRYQHPFFWSAFLLHGQVA